MGPERKLPAIMFSAFTGNAKLMGIHSKKTEDLLYQSSEIQKSLIEKYNAQSIGEKDKGPRFIRQPDTGIIPDIEKSSVAVLAYRGDNPDNCHENLSIRMKEHDTLDRITGKFDHTGIRKALMGYHLNF